MTFILIYVKKKKQINESNFYGKEKNLRIYNFKGNEIFEQISIECCQNIIIQMLLLLKSGKAISLLFKML